MSLGVLSFGWGRAFEPCAFLVHPTAEELFPGPEFFGDVHELAAGTDHQVGGLSPLLRGEFPTCGQETSVPAEHGGLLRVVSTTRG